MPAHALASALTRSGIVCEKAGTNAITFVMAMGLPDEAPARIVDAMRKGLNDHSRLIVVRPRPENPFLGMYTRPECTPGLASRLGQTLGQRIPLADSVGWIATEMIEVYPPGIPVIVPGFRIAHGAIAVVNDSQQLDAHVQGTAIDQCVTVISTQDVAIPDDRRW